jgi:hypothetical protein
MAAIKLVADGSQPVYQSLAFVNPSFNSGYAEFCTDTFGYPFHEDKDIDFNGPTEHVSHRLRVILPGGATVAFGGVRLLWHRQVSPAPAAPPSRTLRTICSSGTSKRSPRRPSPAGAQRQFLSGNTDARPDGGLSGQGSACTG